MSFSAPKICRLICMMSLESSPRVIIWNPEITKSARVEGLENRSILKSRLIDTCEGMRRRIVEEAKRIAELL